MAVNLLARGPTDRVRILDQDGRVENESLVPELSDEEFLRIYQEMKTARHFDERCVSLQRQGRMGTYPPVSGQEAAQVGSALALAPDDWVIPSYREHAVLALRGVELERVMRYWMGDPRGARIPDDVNSLTIAVPIATQILHATGMAWAARLKGDDRAFIVYFGDGATSEGDFHEGLNFGGVFDVPCVYFCNNNQWAISVPRERQTAAETLAQKATAYGFEGVQVDGMDPLAVYAVTKEALLKARDPGDRRRPTLIEAVQYRYGAHTTADDPSRYRPEEELADWKELDPMPRYERFLTDRGLLDEALTEEIGAQVTVRVDKAVETAESTVRPDPDTMFEYVFEELTPELEEQREWLRRFRGEYGDDTILQE